MPDVYRSGPALPAPVSGSLNQRLQNYELDRLLKELSVAMEQQFRHPASMIR
jgi:hypothetical protein